MSLYDLSDNVENDTTVNTDSNLYSNSYTCNSTFTLSDFQDLIRKADQSLVEDKIRRYSMGAVFEANVPGKDLGKKSRRSIVYRRRKDSLTVDNNNDLSMLKGENVFKNKLVKRKL
jgi:hypothetical protein